MRIYSRLYLLPHPSKWSHSLHFRSKHGNILPSEGAFTLPELLIGGTIGVILIIMGASIAVENAASTKRLLTLQALRANWTRVTLLINTDSSEACSISKTSNSLSFRVPSSTSGICDSATPLIMYSILSDGSLARSGPPVRRDGTLNFSGTNTSDTIFNSALLDTSCASSFNSCYILTLNKDGQAYSGDALQTAGNRARVRSF